MSPIVPRAYTLCMTVATRVALADFLAMAETKPYRELIDGEVVEKAMPTQSHSDMVFELAGQLREHLKSSAAGKGATELRHVFLPEERVYLPDVSFIAADRLPPPDQNPVEVVPDFVVEVLSPDDRAGDILEKVQFYLRAGVGLIWFVDPQREVFRVYRQNAPPEEHHAGAVIEAIPPLPGFHVDVAAAFAAR